MKKILWLILIAGISLVNVCTMNSIRATEAHSVLFAIVYITIFGYYVSVKKKFDFKEILLLSLLERSGIIKNEWSERKQRTVLSCISIPLLFIFYILSFWLYLQVYGIWYEYDRVYHNAYSQVHAACYLNMLSYIIFFFIILVIILSVMIWINKAPKEESNKNNTTI